MHSVIRTQSLQFQKAFTKKLKVYLWVVSFVGKYRMFFFLLLLTGFINSGVLLAIPKFIQYIIDSIIPTQNLRQFILIFSALIPMIGIMLVSLGVRNLVQRIVQERSASDLQIAVFQHIRKLGFSYCEGNPTGEILSMFQAEVPAIQNIYRRYLPLMIEKVILLGISIALMIALNAKLSLLIIPCFLSYYLIGPYFEKKQSQYSKEGSKSRTEFNKKIYDSLSAFLELRIHRTEEWDMSQLINKFEKNRSLWLKELLYALLRGTARRITINAGALVLFIFGSYSVRSGDMQVGQFVAFVLFYFQVMGDLTRLVTATTEQSMLLVQAEKLYDLVKQKPEVPEPENPQLLQILKGKLTFENVSFGYRSGKDILQGVHFEICPGERVALVGSSGGGKSTLIKLVGRFYDPHSGGICLDDIPIRELSFVQLRGAVGYVFQETYLFGSSIRENILFGNPDASDNEIIQAAKAANAHGFIMELPEGYDTLVGERGIKLSGGQKQRIAIARMLLKNPAIVLLDEATSSLDNISEKEVQEALNKLLEGRTTIAVAHRLSTVHHYDRIVVLENGSIAEMGSYDELLQRKGVFYRLTQGEETICV